MLRKLYHALAPRALRERLSLGRGLWKVSAAMRIILSRPGHSKKKRIRFEVHVVDHCNLKCAGCSNFSPFAQPRFVAIEEFERDLKRMRSLFGDDCERIKILGGEPLLHPEIISLLKIARENFPSTVIWLDTNGILLSKQSTDFWRACSDNNILVKISNYPIVIGREEIDLLARKFNVDVEYTKRIDSFFIRTLDLSGKQDYKTNFTKCFLSDGGCVVLRDGKLFSCAFAVTVRHFNQKFDTKINISEADYIDIYQETDKDTILRKLSEPTPVCRFCYQKEYGADGEYSIAWHPSKGPAEEWKYRVGQPLPGTVKP